MSNLFEVTQSAAEKILEISKQEQKEGFGLRVRMWQGGCSGPQYQLGLEDKQTEGDQVLDQHGLKVFMDGATLEALKGGKLEWIEGPQGAGFKLHNPNEAPKQGGCACGSGGCGSGGGGGCGSGGGHEHGGGGHGQGGGCC